MRGKTRPPENREKIIIHIHNHRDGRVSGGSGNGAVRGTLIIKDSEGKTIGSEYYTAAFSNKNSKNVGSYKVRVTFKDRYTGEESLTYTINKASNPMKVKAKRPDILCESECDC